MKSESTAQSDVGPLRRIVLMSARDAFSSQPEIDGLWQGLNFTGPPDFELAVEEHEQLVETLRGFGIETVFLPHADEGTLDAIYVRDASVATDRGIILCSMGKEARRAGKDYAAGPSPGQLVPLPGNTAHGNPVGLGKTEEIGDEYS